MGINISPKSLDTELTRLMDDVFTGRAQLPDFQRSWTWDDNRIKALLASLSQGYPMGAIMNLIYGNENVKFKYRPFEGTKIGDVVPEYLVLDGQQRLTSMYRSTCSVEPVKTKNDKGKELLRYYYFDINKCIDDDTDREDAVVSVPDDRKIKENFGKDVVLDISTRDLEYKNEMFPINIIFNSNVREDWADGYKEYYNYDKAYLEKYKTFKRLIIDTVTMYKLPVITLDKSTPREAVCKVFENVNTGGVPLTVFELVTATYATYNFDLRKDWEECKKIIQGKDEPLNTDVMNGIDETAFLTAITLYTTYLGNTMTTCKKKDVLSLPYESYIQNKEKIISGFKMARKFLLTEYVFRNRDLPYTTQLIPLAAICAVIGNNEFSQPKTQNILRRWYWCGILGEMYGGANESRYANDIEDVVNDIRGKDSLNRTVNASYFSAARLINLQTRNSAAYKGIMALVYREKCCDFSQGTTMDIVKSVDGSPDIHHIFPEAYCIKKSYDRQKWNSIINKTPLFASTNRQIGGDAPSEYTLKIMKQAQISEEDLKKRIESHLVYYEALVSNDFDMYFIARAKQLLNVIENAMGKAVPDRDSEQVVKLYGGSLKPTDDNILYLKARDIQAFAVETDESFILKSNSQISKKTVPTYSNEFNKIREELISNGTVVDGRFVNDYEFENPLIAASVVLGDSIKDANVWKNKDGIDLSHIREEKSKLTN